MKIPFIKAKNFTKGRGGKKVKLIVIHTMESGEQPNKAKQVAQWFAGKTAPDASAHYCIDDKYIVSAVDEKDTAWACAQGDTNRTSISIELAGKASQTKTQWNDKYSAAMLALTANLVAELCIKYDIPVKKLTPNQVRTGSGIIGHVDVTLGYRIHGGHTDPGKNFPWKDFIAMVESNYNLLGGK